MLHTHLITGKGFRSSASVVVSYRHVLQSTTDHATIMKLFLRRRNMHVLCMPNLEAWISPGALYPPLSYLSFVRWSNGHRQSPQQRVLGRNEPDGERGDRYEELRPSRGVVRTDDSEGRAGVPRQQPLAANVSQDRVSLWVRTTPYLNQRLPRLKPRVKLTHTTSHSSDTKQKRHYCHWSGTGI